jgi:hypothetical protein
VDAKHHISLTERGRYKSGHYSSGPPNVRLSGVTYPPDLEQEAVQTVLAQAELLLKEISSGHGR